MTEDLVALGADAARLCFGRNASDPTYSAYHDNEWGRPVHDETALFERLALEGFQVGLSWRTVLNKRAAFREAFSGFDPTAVAAFDDTAVDALMTNPGIIRNQAKIRACIQGARALLDMHRRGETLAAAIWGLAPKTHVRPTPQSRPSTSEESVALAVALRKLGFRFVGPVNAYATMQACGVVNDHVVGCPIGDAIDDANC